MWLNFYNFKFCKKKLSDLITVTATNSEPPGYELGICFTAAGRMRWELLQCSADTGFYVITDTHIDTQPQVKLKMCFSSLSTLPLCLSPYPSFFFTVLHFIISSLINTSSFPSSFSWFSFPLSSIYTFLQSVLTSMRENSCDKTFHDISTHVSYRVCSVFN